MKIKFKRSGGFGGLETNVDVDSANLTEENNNQLQALLDRLMPFQQPAKSEGADMQCYMLSVEDANGVAQTLEADDGNASDAMHELFDFLLGM